MRGSDTIPRMRFQFSTSTLLLFAFAAATAIGGILGWFRCYRMAAELAGGQVTMKMVYWYFAWAAGLWVPFVFAAFAIGRNKLTLAMVLTFLLAETVAVWASSLVMRF
jgi:hypothetical protein